MARAHAKSSGHAAQISGYIGAADHFGQDRQPG
ncbi:hypothetical protein ACQKP7_30920 [Pseudomonas frederiksbergensis]